MNNDIVVLIPIYNPDVKITKNFLDIITKKIKNIVFVNDGCDKKYDSFFEELEKKYPVIKHNINFGKGRGLKNGINYILNNYPKAKCLVTADCDGQHSVDDIIKCGKIAIKYSDSLVLGCRNFDQANVPLKSKFGNKLTRNILDLFVGVKTTDTQTGLRAMSLDVARYFLTLNGERYEYETNVLIATKQYNIPIKEVEIETIYIGDNGTSHFNPIRDSIRIYRLFAKYFVTAILAYILEIIALLLLLRCPIFTLSVVVYLIAAKVLSVFITSLFNKHVAVYLIISSLFINCCVLLLVSGLSIKGIIFKVIIDIIILVVGILFNRIKIKKEVLD